MSKAKENVPVLNANKIKLTLEEHYNSAQAKERADLKAKISRSLMETNSGEYAPLIRQLDTLNSQKLNENDHKKLASDISNARKELHKEEKKGEDRVPAVIEEINAKIQALIDKRDSETKLKTDIRKAQDAINEKLRLDGKAAKARYSALYKEHRESENKNKKMETTGIDSLYQMLGDNLRDFTRFIKCHTLYAMMITDALNEFVERFSKSVQEVDDIMASFPLGRFMLSFYPKDKATFPDTSYLSTFIQESVTLKDCSLNAAYRERLREIFTNFMLVGVDCLVLLYNNRSTRIAYEDMVAYFLSVNHQRFGADQVFTDTMSNYIKAIVALNKKKNPEQPSA